MLTYEQETKDSSQEKASTSFGEHITDKFKEWVGRLDGMRSNSPKSEQPAIFSAAKIELASSPDTRGQIAP